MIACNEREEDCNNELLIEMKCGANVSKDEMKTCESIYKLHCVDKICFDSLNNSGYVLYYRKERFMPFGKSTYIGSIESFKMKGSSYSELNLISDFYDSDIDEIRKEFNELCEREKNGEWLLLLRSQTTSSEYSFFCTTGTSQPEL